MQVLLQDIRYALRQLRKSPGFTLVAILTLALGIGANTAIFSIIHGALRLPYPEADRMMAIENTYPQGEYFSVSYPDFISWRETNKSFSRLVASFTTQSTWTGGQADPEVLNAGLVTDGFFEMYGLKTLTGRTLQSADHQKGAAPVCVLAEGFWRKEMHGDPSVTGKPLNLDGRSCTIAGVVSALVPAGGRLAAQVWSPLEPTPVFDQHGNNYLAAVGLLRPGATLASAQSELTTLQTQIDKQFPDNKHGILLKPLSVMLFGDVSAVVNILLAAVGFILLIACVNLANMLLARASDRAREFSIRRALGASPMRMVRQSITESLLLSLTGAALGLVVAQGIMHIPITAWPKGFVQLSDVHLDGTVLAFTALLAIGTGVLFGTIPALRILGQDEKPALQQGRTVTESREQNRTRSILVIAEIALSMLLVAGAVNMAIYFYGLLHVNTGVNTQNTLAVSVNPSRPQYPDGKSMQRFYGLLAEKLGALPGVTHASATLDLPLAGAASEGDFTYDGQPQGTADHKPFSEFHYVLPGYFATVQTPLLEGRDFTPQDKIGSQRVVIISHFMAQKLWPGQSALGKHIHCCTDDADYTIIGVAGDVRFNGPAQAAGLASYLSVNQGTPPVLTFLVRTKGNPMSMAESARHAVAAIDPGQAISDITSLDAVAQESIAGERTSTMVIAILGGLALLLASIGVYGVMAYTVSRREREFGIRIALGSTREGILKLLFSGAFRLVAVGMIAGAALTFAMHVWIDSILGSTGTSPMALVVAALLLSMVAALATWIPARKASRVEPMEALRSE
jgi:putative ABC transport system permease protein